MRNHGEWAEELQAAITVSDAEGTIISMNARSCITFAADGGAALIGSNLFDCHPESARAQTLKLYRSQQPNHYTISKGGQRKIIHQMPWFSNGEFAGFVEISIPIPDNLPHFSRD